MPTISEIDIALLFLFLFVITSKVGCLLLLSVGSLTDSRAYTKHTRTQSGIVTTAKADTAAATTFFNYNHVTFVC